MGVKYTRDFMSTHIPNPLYYNREKFKSSHNIPGVANTQYYKIWEIDVTGKAYSNDTFVIEFIGRHWIGEWTVSLYTDSSGTNTNKNMNKCKYRNYYPSVVPALDITNASQVYSGWVIAGHYHTMKYRLKETSGGLPNSVVHSALIMIDNPVDSGSDPAGSAASNTVW